MAVTRAARRGAMLAMLALAAPLGAQEAAAQQRWTAAWATSQQLPEDRNLLASEDMKDATLRQIVRIRLAGNQLRVRLTNAFGNAPLTIGAATVALAADPAAPRIDAASVRQLRFNAAGSVTIPAGGEMWSDPVALPIAAGADLAITLYFPDAPAQQTGHPGSRATSYYLHGDHTGDADLPGAKTIDHWYQIGGVEVLAEGASAVVTLGDSITDGSGLKPNLNLRWPDDLQRRLRTTRGLEKMAVLNAGIGGNRVLLDGLGPSAVARFDREVLTPPGVTHLIVLEGINDIGTFTREAPQSAAAHAEHDAAIIGALRQIVARARAHGIVALGATLTPFIKSNYYHPDAATEADRQLINAWIRTPGNFDGVIDFDAVVRDPAAPAQIRADYDSGDGLHPSIAGYQAMADAVPLDLLRRDAKPAPEPQAPEIALTFDDLPAHSSLPPGVTRVDVADRILAALKAANAPAIGFVNGVQIEREPESRPVLDHWRAAGLPLGNHGWSHLNLNDISDDKFVEELVANERLLASQMGKEDWHWFRYPNLAEASQDPARRARIRKLLADHGYKVAPVTMSFDDWAYNATYARCMAKHDDAAIATLEASWLEGARAAITRYRLMSETLYGRDIPYVLLMHIGALDAELLPQLLDLYRQSGFSFVTLADAIRDPVYRGEANPKLTPDPQGLEGGMYARGLPVPPAPARPPLDTMCQ